MHCLILITAYFKGDDRMRLENRAIIGLETLKTFRECPIPAQVTHSVIVTLELNSRPGSNHVNCNRATISVLKVKQKRGEEST
jgi:hypothetical protein